MSAEPNARCTECGYLIDRHIVPCVPAAVAPPSAPREPESCAKCGGRSWILNGAVAGWACHDCNAPASAEVAAMLNTDYSAPPEHEWPCTFAGGAEDCDAKCPGFAPPETTAPTATTHGFHQRDGWYFKRLENGAVRIRKTMSSHPASAVEVEQIIPAEEWVSVVAHLSAFTDGAVAYGAASELHHGPQ